MSKTDARQFVRKAEWTYSILGSLCALAIPFSLTNIVVIYEFATAMMFAGLALVMELEYRRLS